MKQALTVIVTLSILMGCGSNDCNRGNLSDELLNAVPYLDGETYAFKHSGGFVIEYENDVQQGFKESQSEEYCKGDLTYQQKNYFLYPNYSAFNIYFYTDNKNNPDGEIYLTFGNSHCYIPSPSLLNLEKSKHLINGINYSDVFKIKTEKSKDVSEKGVLVDSVYYNYSEGIIKLIMNNSEYYEIEQ